MKAPNWFLRQLEIIDKRYSPVWNDRYAYWEIKQTMEIDRTDKDTGKRFLIKDPTIAVFTSLNDEALLSLRRRKYNALRYVPGDKGDYLESIKRANRIAKKKMGQIAIERMAEGFMKMYEVGRKQIFT